MALVRLDNPFKIRAHIDGYPAQIGYFEIMDNLSDFVESITNHLASTYNVEPCKVIVELKTNNEWAALR